MPRLLGPDPQLPDLFTLADAAARGLTRRQIEYRVRAGLLTRVARDRYRSGDYLPPDMDPFLAARLDHIDRSLAHAGRNTGTTIGFESGAICLGLPLYSRVPEDVTLVVSPGSWTGRRTRIRFRQGVVDPSDLAQPWPRITSAQRTVLDLARTASLADALSVGDRAQSLGLLDLADLHTRIDALQGQRGCRRARLAVSLIDGLRETPLESASFAYFVEHRLPLPACQVTIRSRLGRFLGRVDFLWEQARLVGEADGRLKYTDEAALYAEKRREDDIRGEGLGVARWGAVDLRSGALAERLRRLLH